MTTLFHINILKNLWKRLAFRNLHFADRYRRINELYRIENPWDLDTEQEKYRFLITNRLITTHFGHVCNLLEVGCGEGHQSTELLKTCEHLYGVDVSSRAVERAKNRCPQGVFTVGDVFDIKLPNGVDRFDLVAACEVLCYMRDINAVLDRFSSLGRACLVTYYHNQRQVFDELLKHIPGLQSEIFCYGRSCWTAAWWRNNVPASNPNRGVTRDIL